MPDQGASRTPITALPNIYGVWVCCWMVDSVQIVLFGVACGVGTDAVSQELLTFLHALRDVESDIRSWCRSPLRTLEAAAAGRYADAADRGCLPRGSPRQAPLPAVPVAVLGERPRLGGRPDGLQDHVRYGTGVGDHG